MNTIRNVKTAFVDLGQMDYKEAWDYQASVFERIQSVKTANRSNPDAAMATPNFMLFVEHPHVYTLGKSGNAANLKINPDNLSDIKASFYHINRGGDITYHGPGQIVGYPILDLENFFTDIHKYMRLLEESIILTLAEFGISAGRVQGLTGVWVEHENSAKARKICAMGVKMSRWVTMHGFALNVNTDLSYFQNIVPCGISDKPVTSMERELGGQQDLSKVKSRIQTHLATLFGMETE